MASMSGVKEAHVDMQRPKVLSKSFLLLWPNVFKVLIPENDNSTFGKKQGKLILLLISQVRQLEATNLSSNSWRQLGNFDVWVILANQVWLRLVGRKSTVLKLKWFERREFGLLIIHWQIRSIFILQRLSTKIMFLKGLISPCHGSCCRKPRSELSSSLRELLG